MPKRPVASSGGAVKKRKGDDGDLGSWRVVLTGVFTLKPKADLETALRSEGATVTGAISGKTTHLVLGRTGTNEHGKKTGEGSTKHNEALEKGLPILTEKEVWAILTGVTAPQQLAQAKANSKVKATKKSTLAEKAVFCVQEISETKVSLARLKKEMSNRFDVEFDGARSKTALKKALAKCVEEGRLEKDGASFKLPDTVDGVEVAAKVGVWQGKKEYPSEKEDPDEVASRLAPVRGRWKGLRVLSSKKSKSGRARCGGCEMIIAKGDEQVEVSDASLLMALPGDQSEALERGYTEMFGVISRKKFFIHEGCLDIADEKYERKFQQDWRRLRPQILEHLDM